MVLGFGVADVRRGPVTKVNHGAGRRAREKRVGNMMEGAGVKRKGNDETVVRYLRVSRKLDRFVVAYNQTGIKFVGKAAVLHLN